MVNTGIVHSRVYQWGVLMVSYGHAPATMMPPHDCTPSHSLVRKRYQYDALDWTPPLRPTRDTRPNPVWRAGDDRIPDLRVTSRLQTGQTVQTVQTPPGPSPGTAGIPSTDVGCSLLILMSTQESVKGSKYHLALSRVLPGNTRSHWRMTPMIRSFTLSPFRRVPTCTCSSCSVIQPDTLLRH